MPKIEVDIEVNSFILTNIKLCAPGYGKANVFQSQTNKHSHET